jgi:hypothetical protein
MRTFTIRLSNAAPSWPHELQVDNHKNGASIINPYGSIERLMRRLENEYELGDTIKFERIVCQARYIRTENFG